MLAQTTLLSAAVSFHKDKKFHKGNEIKENLTGCDELKHSHHVKAQE